MKGISRCHLTSGFLRRQMVFLIAGIFLVKGISFGQYDFFWAFGNGGGLDFSSGMPVSIRTSMNTLGGTASVCDRNGNPLFYSDGGIIYNRNGQSMPNSLMWNFSGPGSPVYSNNQSAAIVAILPRQSNRHYLFSQKGPVLDSGVYYSEVDMRLRGGLGDVVTGRKLIPVDEDRHLKGMIPVRGENCNVWLVSYSYMAKEFVAYEVTHNGIITAPVVSPAGINWFNGMYARIEFSGDRKKMAVGMSAYGLALYDFDPATGIISNPLMLDSTHHYGLEFSPEGSKLYTTGFGRRDEYLAQFDLSLPDGAAIRNSRQELLRDTGLNMADLRAGPDGRIYFFRHLDSVMHVIQQPERAGAACDIRMNEIRLLTPTHLRSGLPNKNVIIERDTTSTTFPVCFQSGVARLRTLPGSAGHRWSNGMTDSVLEVTENGKYWVTYQLNLCEFFSDTFHVSFHPMPEHGADSFACVKDGNGQAWAHNRNGDQGHFIYTWLDEAGKILRTAAGRSGDSVSGLSAGRYTLRISTAEGCDSAIVFEIQAYPKPDASFAVNEDVCRDMPFQLTGHSSADTLTWLFADSVVRGIRYPEMVYHNAGVQQIMLVAGNEFGCTDTVTQTVTVRDFSIDLRTETPLVNKGSRILLSAYADEAYSVTGWEPQWKFADQQAYSQETDADSSRVYKVRGESVYGCADSAEVKVLLHAEVYFPTAFSPNGDGVNDLFRPVVYGTEVRFIAFRVFDRWGREVWTESGGSSVGWPGTVDGTPADIGVYFYLAETEDIRGVITQSTGEVTLVR